MTKISDYTRATDLICRYFQLKLIKSRDAQSYLRNRRISQKSIKRFRLGYAPINGFRKFLEKYDLFEIASELKLIDDRPFFTNRIIIPIIHAGLIVGFSGRALSDIQPKYINSPKSFLFNKREVLFGLHQSKRFMYKRGSITLVEGYFDVISLVQCGIGAVAVCGTSLSERHVEILSRWVRSIKIMMDGDKAGREAAKKMKKLLIKKMAVDVVKLPNDLDPDEYIRWKKSGRKKLKKVVK